MHVKLILPSLKESGSPDYRPVKYSLFPPLGLATLAGHLPKSWGAELVDQHVSPLNLDDQPDMVLIQVMITNAKRAYAIADHYRSKGVLVLLGGIHPTSMPQEALAHADVLFLGPADESFPRFLTDFKNGTYQAIYRAQTRCLECIPPVRRDLIRRHNYLVPNSLVVSRGCPHRCSFCYKENFYAGGRSFYTQPVEKALEEIQALPGRHLYFLDDHLLGNPRYSRELFSAMRGLGRLFQAAATVDSIIKDDTIEEAVAAGLRSVFMGFESLSSSSLKAARKDHNHIDCYHQAIHKLRALGVRINGSFVFGLDGDEADCFERTVDWAVREGLTTATFHIATPYPGTQYFNSLEAQGRILHKNWDLYDTRHAVFKPLGMTATQLEAGYHRAYDNFYSWRNIAASAHVQHGAQQQLRQLAYSIGWKKAEPLWSFLIRSGTLQLARPLLEGVLNVLKPTAQPTQQMNNRRPVTSHPFLPVEVS